MVGWATLFDTSSLQDGQHTLQVGASSQQGMHAVARTSFTTSNAAKNASQGRFVVMDYPSANTTISQTVNIAGWAVDRNSSIQSIVISVDGVETGIAKYGSYRPDVCSYAVFRGQDCPYVGWSYSLDTSYLSNGMHAISAIEYASDGRASTSQSVLVSNSPGSMLMSIDAPQKNSTARGVVTIGGWVIDRLSAIAAVSVSLDGIPVAPAQYGLSRPDVCAVYAGRVGCPNVGWALSLDTRAFANGSHVLQVTGLSARNVRFTQSVPFSIAN
jgi:hypothetical protein